MLIVIAFPNIDVNPRLADAVASQYSSPRMPFLTEAEVANATETWVNTISGGRLRAVQRMPGGASLRRYYRLGVSDGSMASLVVMETGDLPISDEATANSSPTEMPFVNVQRFLAAGQIAVPALYHHDLAMGLLYLEDLGDITFESQVLDASEGRRREMYRLAIDELVRLQEWGRYGDQHGCIAFQRSFDFELLRWELDHFKEYGLLAQGIVLSEATARELDGWFADIARELAAAPLGLTHRDYQSRNLMVQAGPRLRLIDFQDALRGNAAYDLVGLLRDSYVALSPSLLAELEAYYVERAQAGSDFARLFRLQTVQRKLKDAGRFVFIEDVKGLPGFKKHIPQSLSYVANALCDLPDLAPLSRFLADQFAKFS